jgi:hypothetical protein
MPAQASDSKAARAAFTARSMSAGEPLATLPSDCPVAGLMLSKRAPPVASWYSPLMNSRVGAVSFSNAIMGGLLVFGTAEKFRPWNFSARGSAGISRAALPESRALPLIQAGASCPGAPAIGRRLRNEISTDSPV